MHISFGFDPLSAYTQNDEDAVVALHTLESFPFHKWMLSEFLKEVVVQYLYSGNMGVRKAAVATASHLMVCF